MQLVIAGKCHVPSCPSAASFVPLCGPLGCSGTSCVSPEPFSLRSLVLPSLPPKWAVLLCGNRLALGLVWICSLCGSRPVKMNIIVSPLPAWHKSLLCNLYSSESMQETLLIAAAIMVCRCCTLFFKEGIVTSSFSLSSPTHVSWFFWNAELEVTEKQVLLQKGPVAICAGWSMRLVQIYLWRWDVILKVKACKTVWSCMLEVWNFHWNLWLKQLLGTSVRCVCIHNINCIKIDNFGLAFFFWEWDFEFPHLILYTLSI